MLWPVEQIYTLRITEVEVEKNIDVQDGKGNWFAEHYGVYEGMVIVFDLTVFWYVVD